MCVFVLKSGTLTGATMEANFNEDQCCLVSPSNPLQNHSCRSYYHLTHHVYDACPRLSRPLNSTKDSFHPHDPGHLCQLVPLARHQVQKHQLYVCSFVIIRLHGQV